MYKFPVGFCDSKKANKILEKYYNRRLYDAAYSMGIEENDSMDAFIDCVKEFYPETYPKDRMAKKYLDLLLLLRAGEKIKPDLMTEYMIDKIMKKYISEKKTSRSIRIFVPKRGYILNKLREEWDSERFSPEDYLKDIEMLDDYETSFFSNLDFIYLDTYSVEQLKEPLLMVELGIQNRIID